jgi:hypothetical protein
MDSERSGYMGGILGIDITSHRHHELQSKEEVPAGVGGKIQVLKREEISIRGVSPDGPILILNMAKDPATVTITDHAEY